MDSIITRQIVLDTETTGMNMAGVHYEGHRIIEIGAVEVINRRLTGRHFHQYINPERPIDAEAFKIHGISDESLQDKPKFADIVAEFIDFVKGAELIIHNASFDTGFINHEFSLLTPAPAKIETFCQITDSLAMARQHFPGKRNNLDALCERYTIDNSKRTLHGALLDAEILAEVYLAMTGGQTSLAFTHHQQQSQTKRQMVQHQTITRKDQQPLIVQYATSQELAEHDAVLQQINKKGDCLWSKVH